MKQPSRVRLTKQEHQELRRVFLFTGVARLLAVLQSREPLCAIAVGSEEARLRAGLRPPLKLHVRVARMQLSRRLSRAGVTGRY